MTKIDLNGIITLDRRERTVAESVRSLTMTIADIVVDELDLLKPAPAWLSGVARKTGLMLAASLPYQQSKSAFASLSPQGGVVLVKVLRVDRAKTAVYTYDELAELASSPEGLYDIAFGWDHCGEYPTGPTAQLYAYIAVCMARAAARACMDTAGMLERRERYGEELFDVKNLIAMTVTEDGTVSVPEPRIFGDIDRPGAVIGEDERFVVLAVTAGLGDGENHVWSNFVIDYVLLQLKQLDDDMR